MEKWIVEVELMGRPAWLIEVSGIHFPGAVYDFVFDIREAKQYNTEAEATQRARKVGVAYCPQVILIEGKYSS
jgi:hypothetical protein